MQTRINLLPWRETLKKEREVRFYILTGASLVLTGLVILAVHIYMEGKIGYQNKRNNYIQAQIKEANAKIEEIKELDAKKQRLIERMNVIQELEEKRPQIVHVFDELVKQVPDGVYFTKVQPNKRDQNIILLGVAQSEARVSSLMNNIEQRSQWFSKPKIHYIEVDKKNQGKDQKRTISRFKLEVTPTVPQQPTEDKSEK
jgi:type IV pilus assembly protein PilN